MRAPRLFCDSGRAHSTARSAACLRTISQACGNGESIEGRLFSLQGGWRRSGTRLCRIEPFQRRLRPASQQTVKAVPAHAFVSGVSSPCRSLATVQMCSLAWYQSTISVRSLPNRVAGDPRSTWRHRRARPLAATQPVCRPRGATSAPPVHRVVPLRCPIDARKRGRLLQRQHGSVAADCRAANHRPNRV